MSSKQAGAAMPRAGGRGAAPENNNTPEAGARPLPKPIEDGRMPHLPLLREQGIDLLVDIHSHWFPEKVERKIWGYFDKHYWPIAYRHPVAERIEWMRRNGVKRWTTLNYAHRPGMAAWLNEWSAGFAAGLPQAIPCGTFFAEPEAGEDVRRCIEEYGFRGFKLHLRVSGFDPNDPLLAPAFEQIGQAGLPVVLHTGNAPEGGRFTAPENIQKLTTTHPGLKVIVAHMGAWEFEEYLSMAEQRENVYLDTAMVFVDFPVLGDYPEPLFQRLEKISHKVLFGTDFPMIPYPISHAVERLLALPLSTEAKRRILGENALRLYGLEQ